MDSCLWTRHFKVVKRVGGQTLSARDHVTWQLGAAANINAKQTSENVVFSACHKIVSQVLQESVAGRE